MNKIGSPIDGSKIERDAKIVPEYLTVPNVLTKKECDGLLKYALSKGRLEDGMIGGGRRQKGIRSTRLYWFDHQQLNDKISDIIYNLNEKYWDLKIDSTEFFQLGIYQPGDHYSWHQDASRTFADNSRKLSLSIELNDSSEWQGGKFQIMKGVDRNGILLVKTIKNLNKTGTMVVFPSTNYHRVTPITSGKRISLVGWVWGKKLT